MKRLIIRNRCASVSDFIPLPSCNTNDFHCNIGSVCCRKANPCVILCYKAVKSCYFIAVYFLRFLFVLKLLSK